MQQYENKVNREKLQEVLDYFVRITGIRAAYYENLSETILGLNEDICGFCKSLRQYETFDIQCRNSDAYAFKTAAAKHETILYKCPSGLWEAVVPLYVNNSLSGFLMLGQVKSSENQLIWHTIEDRLKTLGTTPETIHSIYNQYIQMPDFSEEKIIAAAKMLEITAQYIINTEIVYIRESTLVQKIRDYLNEHYADRTSIKDLCAVMNVSRSTLLSLFKKETGHTITGYIENLRINNAKKLLNLTDLSIKEVAYTCGYDDQNYFSRVFKNNTSISPIQYRISTQ